MSTKPRLLLDSIEEIDETSWLIGGQMILSLQSSPSSTSPSWGDGNGLFYVISEAVDPIPPTLSLQDTSRIKRIHRSRADVDDDFISAVWDLGSAVLKVQTADIGLTREHVTLEYVRSRKFSFKTPEVFHHDEFEGRYYLFLNKVPGYTLHQVWCVADETLKGLIMNAVAEICNEMATCEGSSISGVDGNYLCDDWLSPGTDHNRKDYRPETMLECAKRRGLDCSSSCFVFYHCDLSAGNIMICPETATFTVIDWQIAGFVPRDWVATKFSVSWAINQIYGKYDERWPKEVISKLKEYGFNDLSAVYQARTHEEYCEQSSKS